MIIKNYLLQCNCSFSLLLYNESSESRRPGLSLSGTGASTAEEVGRIKNVLVIELKLATSWTWKPMRSKKGTAVTSVTMMYIGS